MIGMHFTGFVALLIVGLTAAGVVHYAVQYGFLEGFDGFLPKWVMGWIGGWIGSSIFGYWFSSLKIESVYIIPALLGSFSAVFMGTAFMKTVAVLLEVRPSVERKAELSREFKAA